MTTQIVTVNVTQTVAPTPSVLQKSGAMLSQGATNTTPGSYTLLTQSSSLTPILNGAKAISSITYPSPTTITSGSYVSGTGIITLNFSGLLGTNPEVITVSALTGTGGFAALNGTWSLASAGTNVITLNGPIGGAAATITGGTFQTNNVLVTTATPHGLTIGDTVEITISGVTPAGYNGTVLCYILGASTFNYVLLTNPGIVTVPGVYSIEDVGELSAMVTTFFAQGSQQGVWVLELGAGNPTDGTNFLSAWIIANPGIFYAYLTPRTWDGNATFLAFIAGFEALTAKTYFFVTTTLGGYQNYTALMKCVVALIEAPSYGPWPANAITAATYNAATGQVTATTTTNHTVAVGQWFVISGMAPTGYNGTFQAQTGTATNTLVYNVPAALAAETTLGTLVGSQYTSAGIPSTEFSLAAAFWVALNYNPSVTNKVTPFAFSFLFGVTPFPIQGNSALLTILQNAKINIIGTGAQGGIANTLITLGTTADGNQFTYWYSVDWAQINGAQAVANAVINGSNNPVNPLYYNQQGINTLQQVLAAVMTSAVTFGMALGSVKQTNFASASAFQQGLTTGNYNGMIVVNAVPFVPYSAANPTHYALGIYNGLSVSYITQNGFLSITFNIAVTQFVVPTV